MRWINVAPVTKKMLSRVSMLSIPKTYQETDLD